MKIAAWPEISRQFTSKGAYDRLFSGSGQGKAPASTDKSLCFIKEIHKLSKISQPSRQAQSCLLINQPG
jgi:hypothetical protein